MPITQASHLTVAIRDIIVDKGRQRKSFNEKELNDLWLSIQDRGLINPLTIRLDPLDGTYHLVAGERRYRAILSHLGPDEEVPCCLFENLSPFEQKAIELEENLRRADLSPTEEAEALAELHETHISLSGGEKTSGKHDQSGAWGISDTAGIIGKALSTTSADLELGQTLQYLKEENPEVYNHVTERGEAKSKSAIKRRIDRLVSGATRTLEAKAALAKAPQMGEVIERGDARELIKKLPDSSVDLIITDPPWGVLDEQSLRQGLALHVGREGVSWDEDGKRALEVWRDLTEDLFRVLKDGSHLYCFINAVPRNFERAEESPCFTTFAQALVRSGFLVRPAPLVWVKDIAFGHVPDQFQQYPMCTESIIFARKGSRTFNEAPSHDYFINGVVNKEKIHLAEKPVDLIGKLINHSGVDHGLFLDPFSGSGALLLAAATHKKYPMRIKGFELSEKHHADSLDRLMKRLNNARDFGNGDLPAVRQMEEQDEWGQEP
jgi:ParB/RepB/Spo0J family partition protein